MISYSQIAKRMGISRRRMEQLINNCSNYVEINKLRPKPGKVDEIEFIIAYKMMMDDKYKTAKSKDSELEKANIRLRLAQAEVAEIELKELNQSLVPKNISVRFITNIFGNVRNKLLSSPNRIAFQVFSAKTIQEARIKVRKIIEEILNELSDPEMLFKKNKKSE